MFSLTFKPIDLEAVVNVCQEAPFVNCALFIAKKKLAYHNSRVKLSLDSFTLVLWHNHINFYNSFFSRYTALPLVTLLKVGISYEFTS